MTEAVFHTRDIPPAERLGYWQECVARTHAPLVLSSDEPHTFQAYQKLLDLDGVLLWPSIFRPVVFTRTRPLIRGSDPENLHLTLIFRGRLEGDFGRTSVDAGTNEISVIDSSTPFSIRASRGHVEQHGIGLEIPRSRLTLPEKFMGRIAGAKFSAASGYGSLTKNFLRTLVNDPTGRGPGDADRLSTVLCDLLSGMFAQALETEGLLPPETRRQTLLIRVKRFIDDRLGDPDLDPSMVATAHHISVRYLQRIFQEEGDTASTWIRKRRLAHARHDLGDEALAHVPVYLIAKKWGFSGAAVFSRTFRDFYGVSPKEVRPGRADE
ncbi:helix-turn-helix domain-containing protein [Nocardiopsis sp. MG754419]|uniref:helix-turn-helix domain-containing protein n=1 Tax=Nocardiopsis sp. MG754419 TaxID=2259865 RepID=UPI001BA79610|nr:helix-turn-helix domain-containing protein [Nocardiopsis sp. MG754419]MBR8741654.1 AraC family transcriptional regulator [Nocardiopsis sp. MG754419]